MEELYGRQLDAVLRSWHCAADEGELITTSTKVVRGDGEIVPVYSPVLHNMAPKMYIANAHLMSWYENWCDPDLDRDYLVAASGGLWRWKPTDPLTSPKPWGFTADCSVLTGEYFEYRGPDGDHIYRCTDKVIRTRDDDGRVLDPLRWRRLITWPD